MVHSFMCLNSTFRAFSPTLERKDELRENFYPAALRGDREKESHGIIKLVAQPSELFLEEKVWTKLTSQLGMCGSFIFVTFIWFLYPFFLSIFSKARREHSGVWLRPTCRSFHTRSLDGTHTFVSLAHGTRGSEQRSAGSARRSPSQSVLQEVNICIYALWVVPGFNKISDHHVKCFEKHIATSLAHPRDSLVLSLIFSGETAKTFFFHSKPLVTKSYLQSYLQALLQTNQLAFL